MSDMLSQAEIDALLNGTSDVEDEVAPESDTTNKVVDFSDEEADALGEIGNINMGTSATTLFTLLGQKVMITTPQVTVTNWDELSESHPLPFVAVKVEYTEGLEGSNLLIMKESDVKIIADLMMGGDGTNIDGELSDFHLSAIAEAMNQMIGSSSTSMSSMFNKKIDISPPNAFVINFKTDEPFGDFDGNEQIVQIAFRMVIGDLIDSQIMQLLPIDFAKGLVSNLLHATDGDMSEAVNEPNEPAVTVKMPEPPVVEKTQVQQAPPIQTSKNQESTPVRTPINVQPAQFQAFDEGVLSTDKENISLIMDVPLELTVELGRTRRLIKDILEFVPGSIIELDKLAGEPIDILVNGKMIAKGEVVVIDESFGVRITDIVNPSKRI